MSTNWTSVGERRAGVKSRYGLAQPYDFTRAIPLIVAILFLCVFVVTTAAAAHYGKLHWGTFRFIYFAYLCGLALVAAATSFAPRVTWSLLALAFIDFSLGMSTPILARNSVETASLLPIDNTKREFSFHPLLHVVPTPNFDGVNPFGVTADFRKVLPIKVHHDSYGLRGVERNKDRLQQTVIAAVGGSTTYDIAVGDGETWPDLLERELGSKYAVLNYGVPAYSTAENLIQTLFYLNAYDTTPRCAIYYVGWNDIHNAHDPSLDPGYAGFHDLEKIRRLQVERTPLAAEVSPTLKIIVRYLQLFLDTVRPPPQLIGYHAPQPGSDSRLEKIYRRSIESIAAINAQRKITAIFVGQMLNRTRLQGDRTHAWSPLVRDRDFWPLQARFNTILKETAEAAGSPALVPPIDEFHDSDFVDTGHFSPQGAKKFAAMLAPLARANCQGTNQVAY